MGGLINVQEVAEASRSREVRTKGGRSGASTSSLLGGDGPSEAARLRACRGALSEAFMDGALATHLPWSGLQAA